MGDLQAFLGFRPGFGKGIIYLTKQSALIHVTPPCDTRDMAERKKAPGKSFRKGISLIEIVEMFPDDETAERWFEEQRWGTAGEPTCCPLCGSKDRMNATKSRKPLPYWCGSCRRHFSVRSGTVMHRSKIPLRKWADCDLSVGDIAERRVEHEAAP